MSPKDARRGRDIFVGGSVTGSLIGDNNRDINIGTAREADSASLDELRAAIAALRVELQAVGGSADTEEVQSELGRFDQELGKDAPDGDMVGLRCRLVRTLLDPLRQLGDIAVIADRILTLTRTLFGGS